MSVLKRIGHISNAIFLEDFSCRSSTVPRLLYAVKRLITEKDESSWRIHIIRSRQFGRKLVQSVLDSSTSSTRTQSGIDIVAADLFLMAGDYLLVQCDNILQSNCYFLLYFMYKAKSIDYEESCQKNHFPQLFKCVAMASWILHCRYSSSD